MYRLENLDVFIYLRKSRKDIEEEQKAIQEGRPFDTLERHRNRLLDIAKRENHNILNIYEEVVSGEFISERPMIQKLLRELETGIADAVLVVDIDRLGRGDMLDSGILDRAFRYSGTKIITPSEIYDPESEEWELVFGVKSLMARQELKGITRRLQNGRIDSAKEGKSITKKPPYGYKRDENLKLYPDPDTSWVVKKIFEMIANGKGRQAAAQELDRLGVKPPESDLWSPYTVSAIVKNEVYLGHIVWGKTKYTKRNGKYVKKRMPKEKWQICENAHEPIVSEEIFHAANQALKDRHRAPVKSSHTLSNPLAGIVRCEICGRSLIYTPMKDRSDRLRCPNHACKGKQKGVIFELVEEKVMDGLHEIVDSFEIKEKMMEHKVQHENVISLKQKALDKKRKELDQLNKQKNNLHDLLEQGIYDIETFMDRQNIITARLKKIKKEMDLLKSEIIEEEERHKKRDHIIPRIRKVLEIYHHIESAERKNSLLKSVIERVDFIRKPEWKKKDQFEIRIYPKI
ncbi:DNA invertase Pin-like site-specific DNA recombinase [Melghiribacillus thermohalophilus]|uniref:DNA invertase Pin-like site-specific DNA recombinase n=1 Tax=Melghiribacillus thermohalophilus TaxID=1324956 RepID=A0A4R3N5J3_9BACI|nr:recombinase family protein [Melghiribacillus thermohalophilus]TCT23346.1 DNA invertase Pin-like site-specific DNA recombinase [Melghiribacillus thermohalophilus]